jgi:hypothetical protein
MRLLLSALSSNPNIGSEARRLPIRRSVGPWPCGYRVGIAAGVKPCRATFRGTSLRAWPGMLRGRHGVLLDEVAFGSCRRPAEGSMRRWA